MRSITNAVRTQVNKGVSQIIRATMVLADGTTTTLEQSSFFGNIAFEWATSQTGAFDVGSAVISSFKFSLNNFDGDFDDTDFAGARILPMIGIPLDDGGTNVSYIQFGTFYFVSHRTLGNVINCEAYDALKFMDEENCTASFPMTAKQFVTYLKNKYSLVLAENSFTNDGTSLPQVAVSMTDRQALVYAMQLTGNFAVINSAGKLHIGWYNTASAYSAPDVFEHNLWTNNLTITGVKVTPYQGSDGNAVSRGTTDYVVEISNNPFIRWDNVEAVANTLYNRLNGMSFRPGSITVLSSPVYEVGDCLSYTDKAGNTSVTPITNIRYSKSLRTTISCDCGEESTNDLRKIATVIGISGTEITYAVSSNGTTPPSSGWQDAEHMPTADEGEYLWTKVSISFTDGTVKNSYSSAYQGISGISPIVTVTETAQGATISVTDASGETSTAQVQNGRTPTITTSKSGDVTTIYADGVSIGTVTDGANGEPPTITSSKVNGVTTVRADGVVIATINDGSSPVLTATKSGTTTTIYSDGTAIGTIEDGEDGPTGAEGEKGYVHIAWANSANGVTDFSTTVSAGKTYFGSYTDHTEADSTDPGAYNWSLIKGEKGDDATTYTLIVSHAAIAKSASGTFAPASITLTAKSQTGTNAYANYSGRFKIEVHNGSSWSTKYTSSSNENTKSYTIPSGTTQVRCSLYLAGGTSTLLDQQTVPVVSDGTDGGDAYTIILDNESHTFAGGTSAAIAGTATVNVYAYKGATAIAPTVTKANISGLPTGMTAQSVTNDSSNNKTTIVFAVTTSMTTRSGLVTIPVVADGKTFSKVFSYALALKGDTGVSISSVTNYYLATSASSGVTTSTSGWTTTVQTMDATKQYLWNYEVVTGSNNSTLNTTTPVIIGRYGQNGGKGDTGRGITSITEHYQVSSSNTTAPSSWSDTMVNTTATNKYLWNYETITYTDGTTEDSTKRVIGTHGEKGDTGASIASVTNYYLASASSSGVTTSTSGWTTNPTASAATMTSTKQYLWNYEVIKDSNNTTITTTSPVIIGRYGQNGGTGSAGKGITGITEYYLATSASSDVTTSTSGWTTAVQSTTATNKYLWNYEVISYTSGNPYTSDPRIIGTYGDKGDKGDKGDTGDRGATWYAGTGITGTSTTAKVFSGSGVSSAIVGDHYLNTSTQNVYRCTVAGAASTAKWVYEQNIKGEQGTQGNKGDTGDTCYFHIKYSNDGGTTFTGNSGEDAGSYIGTYSDNTEADSTSVSSYKWVKIEGDDGTSVTVSSIKYAVSTTESQPADSAFTYNSVPTVAEGRWLWTLTTYSNGSKAYTKAKQGQKGDAGTSVTVSSIKYAVTTTESQPADSAFTYNSVPTVAEGSWLWTLTTFSNGSKIYSKAKQGKAGTNGTTFTPSVDASGNISWTNDGGKTNPTAVNIKGPQGEAGVGVTGITKTGTSGTVDTYTITYTDNTSTTFTVTNGTNGTNGTSAEWFYGTALTHTSGTATATINGAKVGDMYLNTATSNVYKCTAANTWTYAGNIADGVLDNIEVGGRNLYAFKNTDFPHTSSGVTLTPESDGWIHVVGTLNNTVNAIINPWGNLPSSRFGAGTYTLSVENNNLLTDEFRVQLYHYDTVNSTGGKTAYLADTGAITVDVKGFVLRVCLHVQASFSGTSVDGRFRFKLERGNIATDWTPAPEDVAADIESVQANLVPNLTPWFDRPLTDVYNSTTNPNGYWNSNTLTSALTQLPDGWAHVDVTNSGTSDALLMRAVGRAVNGIVTGGNYTCLVEFRNVVNAAGIYSFYTQQSNGVQFWGDGSYDGFVISASLIVDGAKIYKPMKCVTGPTKSSTLNWLMSIASYVKPSQTVSYDFRVSLYEGTYTGPYKPYVDQTLRADVDAAQTAANNAQTTADRKKQTFITTPTTPYYVGDTYFVNGKLLVCHTERLTGSYTADDWSEDLGYASSDTVATLEASTKTELDTIRSEASANYTSLSDSLDKIQASFNTQVEQTSEDFSIRINGLLESLTSLANDTSTKFAEYSKYFRFTADGLEIGEESNALTLVLDNDKISFRRNGVEFSYWDGSDNSFHVGDIIVDVNQVARFGSFGLVPLEGGDLAWKWLGGST